jgi:hypothetical protein
MAGKSVQLTKWTHYTKTAKAIDELMMEPFSVVTLEVF